MVKSRVEILRDLTALHQTTFDELKSLGLDDSKAYRTQVDVYNALSNALGIINAIGKWRRYELNGDTSNVSPAMRSVLALHSNMVRRTPSELIIGLDTQSNGD